MSAHRVLGTRRLASTITVVVVSLVGAACGNNDDQPPQGSEATASTVRGDASPVGTYNSGFSELMGSLGYLQLMSDGTGRVLSMAGRRPVEEVFQYRIDGDRLAVTSGDAWDCDPDEPGIYEWARVASVLELDPVDESCLARAAAMQPGFDPADPLLAWWSMGDAPIVEIRPGEDPVVVETPIGTIEWALVAEQPALSSLATFDGGFVALTAAESGDAAPGNAVPAEVVVSSDGRTWTPVPSPPVAPEWLGTRGSEVWVASGVMPDTSGGTSWPPLVYVTDDNGSSWRQVAVDPAPPGVEPRATGAAAGPAGMLITTRVVNPAEGPLVWVLGPESFEPVTTPMEEADELMGVWALDGGFLAQTRQYRGSGSFWASPDGRSWAEEADVPTGFELQATDGNTVYGITRSTDWPATVEYVTSFDGGRTWQPAPPRPDGSMDVSDVGLVAVDAGVGWLCFGNAFVSSDGAEWALALAPWPLTGLTAPFVSGNTILIPAFDCTSDGDEVHWVGTLVEASATPDDTVRP